MKPLFDRVLVLDKEAGITSHDAVARVRRALGRGSSAGHAGTLDPFATGVLVIATGGATRIVRFLSATTKTYLADITLGRTTDSDDVTGATLVDTPVTATAAEVEAALARFRGRITQTPPRISAVWVDGERMYRRARRGEAIDAPAREVTVHALEVLECEPPHVRIRVACSAGTYIRSIARDLGEALGCGAHLAALRRETAGPFDLARALPTARLLEPGAAHDIRALAFTLEEALAFLPVAELSWEQAGRLVHGQPPVAAEIRMQGNEAAALALRGPHGRILAMAEWPTPAQVLSGATVQVLRVLGTPEDLAAARRAAEVAVG